MKSFGTRLSRLQRGFTAIEMIVVLIVSISALGLGSAWINNYSDNMLNQSAAEHGKSVADAAARYIKDNNSAVLATATPTVPASITVAMLKTTGYLPSSFTANSPYGQSYSILALEPTAGQLQTLIVTTGGDTIGELNLRRIAQLIGAKGGYISSADTTKAQGAYGGWSMALASYGVTPGAGHVAMALFFEDGALVSDYLYRSAVTGHPELNQMATNLDLGGFRLTNLQAVATIGSACGAGVNTGDVAKGPAGEVLSCQGGTWKTQGGGSAFWGDPVGTFATLPACNAAAAWQVRVVQTPTTGTGARAYACNGAGTWQALGVNDAGALTIDGALTANGNVTLGNAATDTVTINGATTANSSLTIGNGTAATSTNTLVVNRTATEGGACSPNGAVARDAVGLILSCQSSSWKSQGGGFSGGWANVTASRAYNAIYTNNTGKALAVVVGAGGYSASGWMSAYVNGVLIATQPNVAGTGYSPRMFFIVPAGATYQVTQGTAGYGFFWYEMS